MRLTESEFAALGKGKPATKTKGKRREPNKLEAAFVRDCLGDASDALYEPMRLRVGRGGDGLRAAWMTPDWMCRGKAVRYDLQPIHKLVDTETCVFEIKGSRKMKNARASLVAFRAAAQIYGGYFRFALAERDRNGAWRLTWLD